MDGLGSFFDSFVSHAEAIWWFLTTGIWQPLKDLMSLFILITSRIYWEFKIAAIGFAWGTAQSMLDQMSFSTIIANALNEFDSSSKDMLFFFRIPDAVYIVSQAYVTRYIFSFISKISFGIF